MRFKPRKTKMVYTTTISGKISSKEEKIVTEKRCQYCGKTDRELHDKGRWGLYRCETCGTTVCHDCSKHDEAIRYGQGKDGQPFILLYINPKKQPWYSGEIRQTGSEIHFCPKCYEKNQENIKLLKDLIKAHEDLTLVTNTETKRLSKIFYPKGFRWDNK